MRFGDTYEERAFNAENMVERLEKERDAWKNACSHWENKAIESQAREAQLREFLLEMHCGFNQDYSNPDRAAMSGVPINPDEVLKQALDLPQDDTALREALHHEWKKGLRDAIRYLDEQGEDFLCMMAEGE